MAHILIVDDHPMVCFSLGTLVQNVIIDASLHIANTFQDGVDRLSRQVMDLIILDLGLPGGMGIEMIAGFRAIQPGVRILICTARDELFNAPVYMQSGANGFLHKHSTDVEARKAIKAVLEDKRYVSEDVKRSIFSSLTNHKSQPADPIHTLAPREKQVLRLILKGKSLKEIADELGIQVSTVGTQKTSIFRKLNVENIVELVRKIDMYSEKGSIIL